MSQSIGVNLRVTGHCNQGGRKYMEDAFVVAYQQSEDGKELEYAYFGIFDGHGGREAAMFAKEHLMDNIVCQKSFWSEDDDQVLKAIRDGFIFTHKMMWKDVGNWPKTVSGLPSTSGTTSSVAFIRRRKLYIGHVGDSKIVLGFQLPGSSEWYARPLTKDHKPQSPEEKQRINSVGGLVLNKAGVDRVVWNRPRPGHKGPIRRSTPVDQIPFLAVARSLGDLWSYNYQHNEFIVSPVPDVKVKVIDPMIHRCIIFASDGLWNMLSAQNAVRIVQNAEEENEKLILEGGKINGINKQPNNPSKQLVEAALKNWFDLCMRADNTSVVTVMLDPPGPPKSEVLTRQRVMKRLRPRDEQAEEGTDPRPASPADLEAPSSPSSKRKLAESSECPMPKERKLSADHDTSVPRKLPRPVILTPQRVNTTRVTPFPTCPPSLMPIGGQTLNTVPDSPHIPAAPPSTSLIVQSKAKKKGHDPPEETVKENKAENQVLNSTLSPDVPSNSSGIGLRENCYEKPLLRNKSRSDEPCKETVKRMEETVKRMDYSNCKENGRSHLCVVDNIINVSDRTLDSSSNNCPKAKVISKTEKKVPPSHFNLRKSTLALRQNVLTSIRSSKAPYATCRTSSHFSRAHYGLRKLKV